MSTQHTPGPWTWRTEIQERGPLGKGNTIRVSLLAPRPGFCDMKQQIMSANWCTDFDGQVWQSWITVKEADARLIAAAPELLALVIRYRNETPLGHQPHMIAHEADAAIAKATNQPTAI